MHEAGNEFDLDKIANGKLTPVFFGSALTGFGVQTFLDAFVELAPAPKATELESGDEVDPVGRSTSQALSSRFKQTSPTAHRIVLPLFGLSWDNLNRE